MSDAARGGKLRAWLEVLRAPLLLSPIADVLAGWCLGAVEGAGYGRVFRQLTGEPSQDVYSEPGFALAGWPVLLRAMLVGVCLLAAGMAQNAVADAAEDRLRKPSRPVPRGALSTRAVHAAWIGLTLLALAIASTLGQDVLVAAAAIAAITGAYHLGLKRIRIAGCLALGTLRGLDLLLGGLALMHASRSATPGDAAGWLSYANLDDLFLVVPVYAGYIAFASLHASTDDEPPAGAAATAWWSRLGVLGGTALLLLLAGLMVFALLPLTMPRLLRGLAPALLVLAAVRLVHAWRTRPPGAVTGTALSNIYLFDASLVLIGTERTLALGGGALILALFFVGRLALRIVPPT